MISDKRCSVPFRHHNAHYKLTYRAVGKQRDNAPELKSRTTTDFVDSFPSISAGDGAESTDGNNRRPLSALDAAAVIPRVANRRPGAAAAA